MPIRPRKNSRQVGIEMTEDVHDRVRAFAAARGETFRAVVEQALERHLANPPPLAKDVPLPPPSIVPPKKGKK